MDTIADWVLYQPPVGLLQSIPYAVGDFNGDGASDFICYNPNPPFNLAVFLGGAEPDTVPAYMWSSMQWPIGGVKSINRDAADEFLTTGVFLHYGRQPLSSVPDFTLDFPCSGAPWDAVSAGDFNHDGYQDFMLYTDNCADEQFGLWTLHLGNSWIYPEPACVVYGWSAPLNLIGIYTAAGLGDVNGDSVDDVAIGAWNDFAFLGWRGRCIILSGDTGLVAGADEPHVPVPNDLRVSVFPNPFNATTTIELDIPVGVNQLALTTYNLLGQVVAADNVSAKPGVFRHAYDASDLPSGLYLLRVEAGNNQTTQKLMLLR
jgi:hypothetical protein